VRQLVLQVGVWLNRFLKPAKQLSGTRAHGLEDVRVSAPLLDKKWHQDGPDLEFDAAPVQRSYTKDCSPKPFRKGRAHTAVSPPLTSVDCAYGGIERAQQGMGRGSRPS
jgi:hypothetical protein